VRLRRRAPFSFARRSGLRRISLEAQMRFRTCCGCGAVKPVRDFGQKDYRCPPCKRAKYHAQAEASRRWIEDYARTWRQTVHPVIASAAAFIERRPYRSETCLTPYYRVRHQAIMAYGGYRCACCGEGEPTFLTLDHTNNDGARHRRILGESSQVFAWLRRRGYPPGFQVLCTNCNHGRHRNGGTCPHKMRRPS
jgi:hypothetical protein